jgi:hypothetical protein
MIRTSLEQQAAHLAKRKAELGYVGLDYVASNPGLRRKPEKRSLLRRLADLARQRGGAPKFKGHF